MKFNGFALAFAAGLLLPLDFSTLLQASEPRTPSSDAGSDDSQIDDRIQVLIRLLADASYSKRQNARAELERIGVVALDRLHAASFDADPQIASAARFIVRSNQFNWAWEYDSPKVREILGNFGAAEIYEKSVFIDELARLERDEGLAALCRLARYETVGALAKKAAIHVLKSKPLVGQSLAGRSQKILRYIEGGTSTSSLWIHTFHSALANEKEFDSDWWIRQIENERALIGKRTQDTSVEVTVELIKWVTQQLSTNPPTRGQALDIAEKLLEPSMNQSLHRQSQLGQQSAAANAFAQWALQLQLPELVHRQHKLLPIRIIAREPIFTYYLAESYLQLRDKEKAERIALAAWNGKELERHPLDWMGDPIDIAASEKDQPPIPGLDAAFAFRNRSSKENSYVLGKTLADRGRFEWAERELKQAAGDDLTLDSSLMALFKLAEIQQSLGKHIEAKLTLEPFVLRLEKEPMFRRQMVEQSQLLTFIVTSYHQYAGDAARMENNPGEAARQYILSLDASEENVDALIGLYKLETGPELQAKRRERLRSIVTRMKDGIRKYDQFLRDGAGNDYFQTFSLQLANELNSLAWLIANTEGDFGEAILMSRRACALNPEHAEYLDTLAHCYFAAGKWKDAVEQQRKALALKPNHPDFQRAVARFQAKLTEAESPPPK